MALISLVLTGFIAISVYRSHRRARYMRNRRFLQQSGVGSLIRAPTAPLASAALLGEGAGAGPGDSGGGGESNAAYQRGMSGQSVSFRALNGNAAEDPLDADDLPLLRAVDSPVRTPATAPLYSTPDSGSGYGSGYGYGYGSRYSATDAVSSSRGATGSSSTSISMNTMAMGTSGGSGSIADVLKSVAAGREPRAESAVVVPRASISSSLQQQVSAPDASSVPVALLVPVDIAHPTDILH